MATEERSRQRFENFTRALGRLREALAIPEDEISDMERESLVQRFHYTFELAWQVLADRLEREGIALDVATPRRAVSKHSISCIPVVWGSLRRPKYAFLDNI